VTEYQRPRPPIVTQLAIPEPAEVDALEALLSSVDGASAAWAYTLTAGDGRSRRDARELLGAAMDALVRARHAYEKGITRNG
jgi:hypothetical protein